MCKKLPEALVPGAMIPRPRGSFLDAEPVLCTAGGPCRSGPATLPTSPGGREAFLGREWPVLTRPPLVPDAEPEALGSGAAGPKCWAVRAVDGGVEAERLRPKHSLEVWEQTGDQEPGQRVVGREPTREGTGPWSGSAGSGLPGKVREVPSSCTAQVHLKYGLPSPSSASRVRSLRVA